jgi:hypothetical protein
MISMQQTSLEVRSESRNDSQRVKYIKWILERCKKERILVRESPKVTRDWWRNSGETLLFATNTGELITNKKATEPG